MIERRKANDTKVAGHLSAHVFDNGKRVGEHIFVAVNRILLERQRRQFRQEAISEPALDRETQTERRGIGGHHAVKLVAHTFR